MDNKTTIPLKDQILARIMGISGLMTERGTAMLQRDKKTFDRRNEQIERQLKHLKKAFEEYKEVA